MSAQDNDPVGPLMVVIGAVWASATLGSMVDGWAGWAKGAMFGVSVVVMVWGLARAELKMRRRRIDEAADALRREQAELELERAELAAERADQALG